MLIGAGVSFKQGMGKKPRSHGGASHTPDSHSYTRFQAARMVLKSNLRNHLASNVNSVVAGLPASTFTSAVFSPSVSCQAVNV